MDETQNSGSGEQFGDTEEAKGRALALAPEREERALSRAMRSEHKNRGLAHADSSQQRRDGVAQVLKSGHGSEKDEGGESVRRGEEA
eukprot:scaffold232204_cov30-Tisochrysis_lutea.AAC.1